MKYYIKQAFIPFIYLVFMAMTAIGILMIGDNLLWLKILLSILNIGLYIYIVGTISYKEGQESIKVRHANDLQRKEIIRTGEDLPIKIHEEYKWWKGLVFGFIVAIPLIILMILHTVFGLTKGYNGLGIISYILYLVICDFLCLKQGAIYNTTFGGYYLSLIFVPFIIAVIGLSYYLGARKAMLQEKSINESQRRIYGDKN